MEHALPSIHQHQLENGQYPMAATENLKTPDGDAPRLSRGAVEPTIDGSTSVKPQDMPWRPSQFPGIEIKILYEDAARAEAFTSAAAVSPMSSGKRIPHDRCLRGARRQLEPIRFTRESAALRRRTSSPSRFP